MEEGWRQMGAEREPVIRASMCRSEVWKAGYWHSP